MIQQDILELAKLGNLKAIASLINLQTQPKGIKAKIHLTRFGFALCRESSPSFGFDLFNVEWLAFATVKRINSLLDLAAKLLQSKLPQVFPFVEQSKPIADDFAL